MADTNRDTGWAAPRIRKGYKRHERRGNGNPSSITAAWGQIDDKRRRKKKTRRHRRASDGGISSILWVLAATTACLSASALVAMLVSWARNTHGDTKEDEISSLIGFYDELRAFSSKLRDYNLDNADALLSYERREYELKSTYSPEIMERGCPLTVLFMDPRLPVQPAGSSAFFSLESVAAYAADACVLIQTASCEVREIMIESQGESDVSDDAAQREVAERLYEKSLPLFRRVIERGQVRITFPDHEKYGMRSCRDFYNPSAALMNVHFWMDEFIDGVDSDTVLVTQDDAVLCHKLDPDHWRDVAYVGAVWTKESNPLSPEPLEGMCRGMPARWRSWLLPQRKWQKQQKMIAAEPSVSTKDVLRPPEIFDADFPPICSDPSFGPIGNGGFSLRSRKWLVKAITSCPHVMRSGIDCDATPLACKVIDDVNEDFYFGVVLRGLRAPLPTPFEASLFSTEMMFPEEVLALYGDMSEEEKMSAVVTRWGRAELDRYVRMQDAVTVPIGLHKVWWYQPNELLVREEISEECPYLKYIFDPTDSKWHEFEAAVPWRGIGT